MMRQAGRFLPEYRVLKEKYPFFVRVRTPELASEITRMPVDILGVDAAILFSDILVVPDAMGCTVTMEPGQGPRLPAPIRSRLDLNALASDAAANLGYVADAIMLTTRELKGAVPLIGFAGAPWTIMCYMVEGRGSKDWQLARRMLVEQPELATLLLDMITDVTIDYLLMQRDAGVAALQLFDSWASSLPPKQYRTWVMPRLKKIVESVTDVPLIMFARGANVPLVEIGALGSAAVGLDWSVEPAVARRQLPDLTLQGNLDPVILFGEHAKIRSTTRQLIKDLGVQRTVVNLGHGILPDTPVDGARVFIDTVKEFSE
jgi:uroporphyrinogen decarboxylase